MTKRRGAVRSKREIVVANSVTGEALVRATSLARYALTGKMPADLVNWLPDARTTDAVLAHMTKPAMAAQSKAMNQALRPDATPQEIVAGAMVARDVLNRAFGKPVERLETIGSVGIEFSGIDPSQLPDAPPVDTIEVVDLPSPGEDDEG